MTGYANPGSRNDYRTAVTEDVPFWEMYSELPVRTTRMSVGPVVLGFALLLNGYLHGVSVAYTGAFAVVMTVAGCW